MQKARKMHRCDGCKHPIKPGDIYNAVVQKDGGDLLLGKWHARCAAMELAIRYEIGADACEMGPDTMREDAKEIGWRKVLADTRAQLKRLLAKT